MDESSKWIKTVDCGSLIHVSDSVFSVFAEMELVLRKKRIALLRIYPKLWKVLLKMKEFFSLGQLFSSIAMMNIKSLCLR